MKISELTGPKLAEWVARGLGYKVARDGEGEHAELMVWLPDGVPRSFTKYGWRPDLDWAVGGPIIERERIATEGRDRNGNPSEWVARGAKLPLYFGPTPLIAAMRAFVASKFGEEVNDES